MLWGIFRAQCAFFGLLFGVEALPIHDCGAGDIHTLIDASEQQQQHPLGAGHRVVVEGLSTRQVCT